LKHGAQLTALGRQNYNLLPADRGPSHHSVLLRWEGALGKYERTSDWLAFFRNELRDTPWQEMFKTWVPILTPGYFGGLTHGLIRTAYAVRAFPSDRNPSELELDELAHGLAYWAGTYSELPGDPDRHGTQSIGQALAQMPRVDQGDGSALARAPETLAKLPNFTSAIESIAQAVNASEAISRHTALFARIIVAHPEAMPVPFLHSITAPAAMRTLLSFFDESFGSWAYSRLWQVSSAIVALFAGAPAKASEVEPKLEQPRLARDELIARAVAHRDEHVIKLTEACLREDSIRPDPVYRIAAEAVINRMPPWT
jgi:hypothetical protein